MRSIIGILFLFVFVFYASAHGEADWIRQGMFRAPDGTHCCGEHDCYRLADGRVSITAAGYQLADYNEIVPFSEAKPSPEGYWRCKRPDGSRRCFFAPPPNS